MQMIPNIYVIMRKAPDNDGIEILFPLHRYYDARVYLTTLQNINLVEGENVDPTTIEARRQQ
jgi:hypothetical protein